MLFTLDELETAAAIVRSLVPPTPAYAWPLLREATGVCVLVKHENHTPTGSFKGTHPESTQGSTVMVRLRW